MKHDQKKQEHGGGPTSASLLHLQTSPLKEALSMLVCFESVGATSFDTTFTNQSGKRVGWHPGKSITQFSQSLPSLLRRSQASRFNVIIRPQVPKGLSLIQLDDLPDGTVARVTPVSFLVIETSPSNFQVWVAVLGLDDDISARLRKGTGADATASGAARLAGSRNFKPKYAPNYPTVRLVDERRGNLVTADALESSGLLAPVPKLEPVPPRHVPSGFRGRFPNYQKCLDAVPSARNHDGKDRSLADFQFCLIACDRGFSIEEIARELVEQSTKAREEGYQYAEFTASRAADVVRLRRARDGPA